MQKGTSATARKGPRNQVGMAIHALRASVKAFETKAGGRYHYKIADDGANASVIDCDGNVCLTKTIAEWASEGPKKYQVGMAIHALRAYVKAFEMKAGDGVQYSYRIAENGDEASILDPAGSPCLTKSVEDWASQGPRLRLALIGLKGVKDEYERAARAASARANVRFYLNTFDGEATLTADGARVSKTELGQIAPVLGLPTVLSTILPELPDDDLSKIASWARIGRELEIEFFQALEVAEQYNLPDAVAKERERGYRLGILRRPRSQATADSVQ